VTKGTRVLLDGRLGVISGFYEEGGVYGYDVDMDDGPLRWISHESAQAGGLVSLDGPDVARGRAVRRLQRISL
jgi:hypothetical protein